MNLWNGFFHGSNADINFLFAPQEHVGQVRSGEEEDSSTGHWRTVSTERRHHAGLQKQQQKQPYKHAETASPQIIRFNSEDYSLSFLGNAMKVW